MRPRVCQKILLTFNVEFFVEIQCVTTKDSPIANSRRNKLNIDKKGKKPDLITTPKEFFEEQITFAFSQRGINTYPHVKSYLIELLSSFIHVDHLFNDDDEKKQNFTLAEIFLKAVSAEIQQKIILLQKLGEISLYISGFFGDSLQKKLIDIDYYVSMGENAYSNLALCVREEIRSKVFHELSSRFVDYVDVLSFISQESMIQNNESLLRLYEKYRLTGSELAKEKLVAQGVLPDNPVGKLNQ